MATVVTNNSCCSTRLLPLLLLGCLSCTPVFLAADGYPISISDGTSSSGLVDSATVVPLTGQLPPAYRTLSAWPTSYSCSSECFHGAAVDGDYLWLVPWGANMVVRMHKVTGAMTGYDNWPSGSTVVLLRQAVVDATRSRLWFVPESSTSHFISMLTTTGVMSLCPWPTGHTTDGHFGGFLDSTKSYLWSGPYDGNQIVRIDLNATPCVMSGFNSWAAGFTLGTMIGSLYDGTETAWFLPYWATTHVVEMNITTTAMTYHNSWPPSFSAGANRFEGGCVDSGRGEVWMTPGSANMVVKMDVTTHVMTGYYDWPVGFSLVGPTSFLGASFDGMYVWAFPRQATHILRIDPASGAMSGFASAVTGSYLAAVLDFSLSSVWFVPFGGSQVVIQYLLSGTADATVTEEQQEEVNVLSKLQLSDGGGSYSGVALAGSSTLPLNGPLPPTTVNVFNTWPPGYSCSSDCYRGIILVGEYLWLVPYTGNMVIRMHTFSGEMTGYDSWPGVTFASSIRFTSGIYDASSGLLWMVPRPNDAASHFVSIDTNSGTMDYCAIWPRGHDGKGHAGGFIFGHYLWSPPYTANMVVRLDTRHNTLTGFANSWPTTGGFTLGSVYSFQGAIFDGVRTAWFPAFGASHVVEMDMINYEMTGYDAWPGSFSGGATQFQGGCFDGQSVWFAPSTANMIVQMDKTNHSMTGHDSWPAGFVTGTFSGAVFDGKYVWVLPRTASHLLRIEMSSSTLTGFATFPAGWAGASSAVVDFGRSSLWVVPHLTGSDVVQFQFHTATAVLTSTQELGLPVASTEGYSGIIPWSEVQPLHGEELSAKSFTALPGDYSCTETCCCTFGVVNVGEYIWFVPEKADAVVRMHKVSGAMTSYKNWPSSGVTLGSNRFSAALYNTRQERLWMVPLEASHVVYLNVSSGSMGYCPTWPAALVLGSTTSYKSYTGFLQTGDYYYLWLPPSDMNMIVRYDLRDCTPSGYNNWPVNYTLGVGDATQGVYDGEHTMWMLPHDGGTTTAIVKMNLWDYNMTLHDSWPSLFSGGLRPLRGGAFDGRHSLYFFSNTANMFVRMDRETDVMTAVNNWPAGYTHGSFSSAIFDGKYIWFFPGGGSHILRLDTMMGSGGLMSGFATTGISGWDAVRGVVMDMESRSFFLPPNGGSGGNSVLQITVVPTQTPTHTVTQSPTASLSPTATETVSPMETPSATLSSSRGSASGSILPPPTTTTSSTLTLSHGATRSQEATAKPRTPTRSATATPSVAVTTMAVPLPTPPPVHLSVVAVDVGNWIALFTLANHYAINETSPATSTLLQNVTLQISVEAAVRLAISGNSSHCLDGDGSTSEVGVDTSTVLTCTIPTLGSPLSLYVLVSSSLNYQFNGVVTLRYTATADNAASISYGSLVSNSSAGFSGEGVLQMSPENDGGGAVTPSPGSTTFNVVTTGAFGQGEGLGRCIDVFAFTFAGGIVLVLIVLAVVAALYSDSRARGSGDHPDLRVNTWRAIPLWRSLLLQHAYCIVPCHSQCALNHTLPLVTHVFTLMMLCGAIGSTFSSTDVSGVAMTSVLAVILAGGLRPLLVSRFYFQYSLPAHAATRGGKSAHSSHVDASGTSSNHHIAGPALTQPSVSADSKARIEASMVALDNVELESNMGGTGETVTDFSTTDASTGEKTGTGTGTGTGTLGDFNRTHPEEEEEEEVSQSVDEAVVVGQEEEGRTNEQVEENNIEDDVVVLNHHQPTGASSGQKDHHVCSQDIRIPQQEPNGNSDTVGTITRISAQEKDVAFEDDAEYHQATTVTGVEGGSDHHGNQSHLEKDGDSSDHHDEERIVVTPYRQKGHYLVGITGAVVAVIALVASFSITTSSGCVKFERAFLWSLLMDLLLVQPLVVGSTYLYRWLQSDAEDLIWSELHPYDGEERDD